MHEDPNHHSTHDHHPPQAIQKKKKIQNILILAITLVLCLFIIELGLKKFYPQKLYNVCFEKEYPGGPGGEMDLHSHFGWYPKPNYRSCRYQPDTHKIIHLTHNSKGLRILREVPYNKPLGTKRILLLGDSFIHHEYLDDHDTFAVHFENQLPENYEVIPLAASGWGTDQELLAFFEEGVKYEPDIVLLFFYPNDFSNIVYLAQTYADKPVFIPADNDKLNLTNYPTFGKRMNNFSEKDSLQAKQPITAFILRYSQLYSLWWHKKGNVMKNIIKPQKEKFSELGTDGEVWSIMRAYGPRMNLAANLLLLLLDRFKQASEQREIEFIVVNIPSRFTVQKEAQEQLLNKYEGINKSFFNFKKVSRIFRENIPVREISYIDLTGVAERNPEKFYFKEDGHWTSFAVQQSGAFLAKELKRGGLIEE